MSNIRDRMMAILEDAKKIAALRAKLKEAPKRAQSAISKRLEKIKTQRGPAKWGS